MRFLIRLSLGVEFLVLLVLFSQKTIAGTLNVLRDDELGLAVSLINRIRNTNIYNQLTIAMINESVKVDRKGFEKEVFGNRLIADPSINAASVQSKSNIYAFMLSGNQWKMVREAFDDCTHLLDMTFYSATNLSELNPAEINRLKEIYWERLAFDSTSRYGYQWASYGPYQSSVLTSSKASPIKPFFLSSARFIEHEMAFMILASLGQINVAPRTNCHPLIYDFHGVQIDLEAVKNSLDSGRFRIDTNSNHGGFNFTLKTPFDMLMRVRYDDKSLVPFGMIELEEGGVVVRRITRNQVGEKSWSLEWFDEQFDKNNKITGFSKRYILSESDVNVKEMFASFDAVQKKSDLKSHQKNDGSYTDFINGSVSKRGAPFSGSIAFLSEYGRLIVIGGFVSISLLTGWFLFRKR